MRYRIAVIGLLWLGAWGCGPNASGGAEADASTASSDGQGLSCDPGGDDDGDCMSNALEGCNLTPPRDSDNDGTPDYLDQDSDGDGIFDYIEVGDDCKAPRDNDGDGTPDYLDTDSDNDGVPDSDEDRDGDGVVGTCTLPCSIASHCPPQAHCSLPMDGATTGVCIERVCQGGETDPHNQDSDGDGRPDAQEETFICNPQDEDNPFGLKPIEFIDSTDTQYTASNWRLAHEVGAFGGVPSIANATALNAAYVFDMTGPQQQVAGFLASRAAGTVSAINELGSLILGLETNPLIASVTIRASGNQITSLDGFDSVIGTRLEIQTTAPVDVVGLRDAILPTLLARLPADVTAAPAGWSGVEDTRFIVGLQTIRRLANVQALFVGGVARAVDVEDRTMQTVFHLDDMSNGTGVSVSGNGAEVECEPFAANQRAIADIIWVVDESGSVSDDRALIAGNASLFLQKASDAGLDFRLGVTDMNDTGPGGQPGIFATRQAGGTGDRWLLPGEAAQFAADIEDPSGIDPSDGSAEHGLTQGRAAMMRHLPRDDNDPQKIREDAKLVLIYVTDEKPDEVEDAGILSEGNLEPTAAQQGQIATLLAPYIAELDAEDATAHLIAEPLPYDSTTCSGGGAEHAFGYYELVNATGGQVGSICQQDLSATLDALIDDIIGGSSPIVLSKVPISASIAVARNGVAVVRSRQGGFDYRAAANSIVFFNIPFDPNDTSDIVVSYRRWRDQVPVE